MHYKAMIKGISMGAAVGLTTYVVAKSSGRQRKTLRKNTDKAVRAMGAIVNGFSSMLG